LQKKKKERNAITGIKVKETNVTPLEQNY